MSETYFPIIGGKCSNPECQKKHRALIRNVKKYGKKAEKMLERFFLQENAYELFIPTFHGEKVRYVERALSHRVLFELLNDFAEVVECPNQNLAMFKTIKKVVWQKKISYIYYHVLIDFKEVATGDKSLLFARVVTAYNVSSSSHLYNDFYEERHCWCRPKVLEE
jgi:hypothetical protein